MIIDKKYSVEPRIFRECLNGVITEIPLETMGHAREARLLEMDDGRYTGRWLILGTVERSEPSPHLETTWPPVASNANPNAAAHAAWERES